MLNNEQIKNRLKEQGWAEHVWNGGHDYLINSWEEVVRQVEQGYTENYMVEEYWDDLDTREAIKLVELDSEVVELDERFKKALTHTDIRIKNGNNNDFWNYGYPKNAKGYFLQGFKDYIEYYKNN